MAGKFAPPAEFSFDEVTSEAWGDWKSRWERYLKVSGISKKADEERVDALVYALGARAERLLKGFSLDAGQLAKYDAVLAAFNEHFSPKKNVIFERSQFWRKMQQEGESAERFVGAVRDMAASCEFGEFRSEMIRDKLVAGVRDESLLRELQKEDASTLTEAKVVEQIRQAEDVEDRVKKLAKTSLTPQTPVEAVQKGAHKRSGRGFAARTESTSSTSSCNNCGYRHDRGNCPASGKRCRKCDREGHFAKMCRAKKEPTRNIQQVDEERQGESEEVYLDEAVTTTDKGWFSRVTMNGNPVNFKLDTGAEVTVVPEHLVGQAKLGRAKRTLLGPGSTKLRVKGVFQAAFESSRKVHAEDVYVVIGQKHPLLSRNACVALGLLSVHVDGLDIESWCATPVAKDFPSIFEGLGRLGNTPYHIQTESAASPFAVTAPRKVPHPLRGKVKQELKKMLDSGVISPVEGPTEWCAPIVVVPKGPNADKVRICVDYTNLNKVVRREVYPSAIVEDSLANLGKANFYSQMDANSGFFQVSLSEESKALTTFLTHEGRFVFNRLPFGLCSAPEVFQKLP